jgi:chorismate mutase/prephenate dehydratase
MSIARHLPAREAKSPSQAGELRARIDRLRGQIDRLDAELLDRLCERMQIVRQLVHVKQMSGDGVYVPQRERAQLERLQRRNRASEAALPPEAVSAVFREILSVSRTLQGPLSVAYLGPAGTYSEIAAREHFGSLTELLPVSSIGEVFHAVERGLAEFGIVPVENSTEGMVEPTLDAFVDTPLKIVGERELRIRHALLSRARSLKRVKRVVSHPQSLAQCRDWLARNLPGVPTVQAASNALAAEAAARGSSVAAIAGRDAARRYKLHVLAADIQDLARNVTRFVVLCNREIKEPSGDDKISLLFSVKNRPGMLYRSLQPFARHGVDLCKIESRPLRGRPWEYLFYVDFRGHVGDARVRRALAAMEKHCTWLKVLGSYAAARPT